MKELYYIISGYDKPEHVRQALLNKGGIDDVGLCFDMVGHLFYIDKESKIRCAGNDEIKKFIIENGIELQPVQPEETFKPFDKVIVRFKDESYWVVDTFSHKKGNLYYCGMTAYCECHHYKPWMDEYIGTTTPWEEIK